jgi:hypothetical protein
MRIHVWNAFASNNSGSYTIVGSFPTEEQAAQVAAELSEVATAHTVWLEATDSRWKERTEEPSPLETFIKKNGLTWADGVGTSDDWPEYGGQTTPKAWAIGHQVFVHHPYTITLPRTFGELFYARGGRVETELNHTHHPLVSVFELWSRELDKDEEKRTQVLSALVEELHTDDGPLVKHADPRVLPGWKEGWGFGEPQLMVGVAFKELLTGYTALERIVRRHGMQLRVKVFESWENADSLSFLRPSSPRLKREMYDVWLMDLGDGSKKTRKHLEEVLREVLYLSYEERDAFWNAIPTAVRKRRTLEQAKELAEQLGETGVRVEVRRSPD